MGHAAAKSKVYWKQLRQPLAKRRTREPVSPVSPPATTVAFTEDTPGAMGSAMGSGMGSGSYTATTVPEKISLPSGKPRSVTRSD